MGAVARKNIINLNNGLVNRLFSTGTRVANTEAAIDSIGDVPLQSRSMVTPTMRPMLEEKQKSRSSINQWEINSLQTLKRGLLRPLSCFPSYTFPRERPHAQFEPLSRTGERTSRPTTVCYCVRVRARTENSVVRPVLFCWDFPQGLPAWFDPRSDRTALYGSTVSLIGEPPSFSSAYFLQRSISVRIEP